MKRYKSATWQSAFQRLAQHELQDLRLCVEDIERIIKQEAKKLTAHFDERTAKMSKDEKEEHAEWSADEFYHVERVLPDTLRYSLFLHCYGTFEDTLVRLAKRHQTALGLALSPTDLRDDGITRAQTYLKKVARVPFPDASAEWRTIVTLAAVRNIVAHNGALLATDHSKRPVIVQLIASWSDEIVLGTEGRITLLDGFVSRVLDVFDAFILQLFVDPATER